MLRLNSIAFRYLRILNLPLFFIRKRFNGNICILPATKTKSKNVLLIQMKQIKEKEKKTNKINKRID